MGAAEEVMIGVTEEEAIEVVIATLAAPETTMTSVEDLGMMTDGLTEAVRRISMVLQEKEATEVNDEAVGEVKEGAVEVEEEAIEEATMEEENQKKATLHLKEGPLHPKMLYR